MSNVDLFTVLQTSWTIMLWFSIVLSKYFPECCICTVWLEPLLWTARPNTPTSFSNWFPQIVSLNKRKWNSLCCATLWQGNLTEGGRTLFLILLYTLFSSVKKIVKSWKYVGLLALASNSSSMKWVFLILHRHPSNFKIYCPVY